MHKLPNALTQLMPSGQSSAMKQSRWQSLPSGGEMTVSQSTLPPGGAAGHSAGEPPGHRGVQTELAPLVEQVLPAAHPAAKPSHLPYGSIG